jgi:hypothetical protein
MTVGHVVVYVGAMIAVLWCATTKERSRTRPTSTHDRSRTVDASSYFAASKVSPEGRVASGG